MSTTEQIFEKWYDNVSNEFRQQNRSLGEITSGAGREAWSRLDIRTQTALQIFENSIAKHPDNLRYLGREMRDFFKGHTAAEILANESALKVLKLFLGEEQ